ncbi:ATP-binding cassette sub-family A member 17-like [Rhipicephalus microplus]|uniref:ATP-binding cassette sub-family A member 17-like n=1 Tax=Rhipicephalus microplus TaxID=6941 RepID=UPI003F6AF863
MAYCPQRDILFPDMTAWEHLLYFGTLRYMRPGSLKRAAQDVLSMTGLEAHTLVRDLKRRQTKRLSIAIAAISKPKLVVLDEPTAGLHTPDAREIWDILMRLRGSVSLFFSTHNMTEADVLADRVVCLSAGIVICNASPTHLKNVYGVGYKMTLSKSASVPFQRGEVLSVVKRCAPEATYIRESPVVATIALHTVVTLGFDRMFLELEMRSRHLGISSIGLTTSTLRDIYLKLTLASVSLSEKTSWAQQLPANLSTLVSTRGWNPGMWRRVSTLMLERLLFLRTRCRHQLLATLMPLVVLVSAFHWMAAGKTESQNTTTLNIRVPVSVREVYPEARVFLDDDEEAEKGISPYFMHLLEEDRAVVTRYNDTAEDVLLAEAEKDYVSYTTSMVLGAVFRNRDLEAWYNPYAIMSKMIAYGLVSSALLAYKEKSYWARIETTLEVHLPEVVKPEHSHRQKGDPGSEYFEDDPMGHVDLLVHKMAAIWAVMAPLTSVLIVSSFVTFPNAEHCSQFMQLLLMTGVPGWLHCLCHLLFDCALFVWIILPTSVAFALYYDVHTIAYKALFVVFAMSGVLFILSAYVIAYSCKTAFRAHVVVFVVFGLFGALTFFATVQLATGGHDTGFLCSALPPCAVPMSLIKVVALDWSRRACRQLALERLDDTSALIAFCRTVADYKATYHEEMFAGLLRTQVDMCCEMLDTDLRDHVDWSPLNASKVGVGLEVYYLFTEAVILFVYLSCRNSGRFFRPDSVGDPSRGSTDAEANNERRTVHRACAEHTVGDYALVAEEVHKWYGEDYAVCGFNLALPRDECFGLLGVYGCGKSSVAQMLAAHTVMSIGEAYMGAKKLSDSPRQWQSQVGFCPEEDSLLDALSGTETLELFARLRGVRSDNIERLVECVVGVIDLNESARQACGTYSADARRKLSIGLAIIGAPRVVILDDATRGIDTTGRQMIYEALRDLARVSASAIILTSRSTEECDMACTRVGLMAGGEIKALGSMMALRESFSTGFVVTFSLAEKFTPYMIEKSDKAVTRLFPAARRVDCREGTFVYHVANSLPWSEVFSRLNAVSQCISFESVLVAQSSLDEVLLGMGRAEMAEDAAVGRRAVYEMFSPHYGGDPWGRERQLKHERRQKVRERRKKDADENSTEKAAP